MRRLKSGGTFIGAYHNGDPAGILETIGLDLIYPTLNLNPRDVSNYLCRQIPCYDELTDGGIWRPHPKNANTLLLVDITKEPSIKALAWCRILRGSRFRLKFSSVFSSGSFEALISRAILLYRRTSHSCCASSNRYLS